jgi:hypothetical protein
MHHRTLREACATIAAQLFDQQPVTPEQTSQMIEAGMSSWLHQYRTNTPGCGQACHGFN